VGADEPSPAPLNARVAVPRSKARPATAIHVEAQPDAWDKKKSKVLLAS